MVVFMIWQLWSGSEVVTVTRPQQQSESYLFHMHGSCCVWSWPGPLKRQAINLGCYKRLLIGWIHAGYEAGEWSCFALVARLHPACSSAHTYQTSRCTPPAESERCRTGWAHGEPCWISKLCRSLRWSSSLCRILQRGRPGLNHSEMTVNTKHKYLALLRIREQTNVKHFGECQVIPRCAKK